MTESSSSANPAILHRLLVSTRNLHKIGEIRAILGSQFEVSDLSAIPDMPEVEETGDTFLDNASLKAVAASERFDGWVIADDSGLEVDALGGDPGVRSARYAGEDATDAQNNALLLERLAGTRGKDRSARFRCTIAVAKGGWVVASFSGAVEGIIINEPKGASGFGYDPLFVPEGFCETFGQLSPETKNSLSHRGRALAALKEWTASAQFAQLSPD